MSFARRPHVVIIDSYDSFTYNLVQAFRVLGADVTVRRNDAVSLEGLRSLKPDRLVISPGPGSPGESTAAGFARGAALSGAGGIGVAATAIEAFRGRIPVLGVCLGHQAIAVSLGGRVAPASEPCHGKPWWIHHSGEGIFGAMPAPFRAARYHSLTVLRTELPEALRLVAWTNEGDVMALGVAGEPTWGVQFHPESFMTEGGSVLLESFLAGTVCKC